MVIREIDPTVDRKLRLYNVQRQKYSALFIL